MAWYETCARVEVTMGVVTRGGAIEVMGGTIEIMGGTIEIMGGVAEETGVPPTAFLGGTERVTEVTVVVAGLDNALVALSLFPLVIVFDLTLATGLVMLIVLG